MDNTLIDRIVGVFSRAAMPIVSCALSMAITFIPGTALAGADDEGDLDAPNAAAGGTSAQSAQEDTAIDDAVNIAADGNRLRSKEPFALEDFSRSQVGSNSDVNGVYAGYRYFVSDESGSLAVVAADELTVVHVPPETAQAVGFDAERPRAEVSSSSCSWLSTRRIRRAARRCPPRESGRSPESLSSSGTAWSTSSTRSSSPASSTSASSVQTAPT